MKSDAPKVPNQAEAKKDGVINTQNYDFSPFLTRNILMLSKRYESIEVGRRTWLHVPSATPLSTSSDTHQVVEIYDILLKYTILNRIKLTIWTIRAFRKLNPF